MEGVCECKGYDDAKEKRGVSAGKKGCGKRAKGQKIEATLCEASKTKVTEARRLWMG